MTTTTFRQTGKVSDFDKFYASFQEHAHAVDGPLMGKYKFALSRSEMVDESKTKVFRGVDDPLEVCIFLDGIDAEKMFTIMGSEAFKTYNEDNGFIFPKEGGAFLLPAGPDAPKVCDMFAIQKTEDSGRWIEGFKAHASSKTGTWGFEVSMTREEFCDESKTKLFKSVSDPNTIAIVLGGVQQESIAKFMMDESVEKLFKALGEKEKEMYYVPAAEE